MKTSVVVTGVVSLCGILAAGAVLRSGGHAKGEEKAKGDAAMESGKVKIFDYRSGKNVWREKMVKSEEEWRKLLPPGQCSILRNKGTEHPFTSPLLENKKKGIYVSAASGVALFSSDTKFDSGTGWPSFTDVIAKENVILKEDDSMGMKRVEVIDAVSGSHLGHVFPDGPGPTGQRYCINGGALKFIPEEEIKKE